MVADGDQAALFPIFDGMDVAFDARGMVERVIDGHHGRSASCFGKDLIEFLETGILAMTDELSGNDFFVASFRE